MQLWQLAKVAPPPEPTPAPSPVGRDLRPLAVIPVGGTVGSMHVSADEKYVYYLNLTDGKLARIVAATGERDKVVRLADGTDAVALSRDGKTLATIAQVTDRRGAPGRLQMIDALTMEPRRNYALSAAAYDVAFTDAGLVFLSGAGRDWTDVAVFDTSKGEVVTRWGGIWRGRSCSYRPTRNACT